MDVLSFLALIFFTLVGYSSGRVRVNLKMSVKPGVLDIILVAVLWIGASWIQIGLGKGWAILVWLLTGSVVGAMASGLLRDGQTVERKPITTTSPLFRAWESWVAFARVMGEFQSRLLLILFYFVIVTPFGLAVKLGSDPLHLREIARKSLWQDMPSPQTQIDEARKQF